MKRHWDELVAAKQAERDRQKLAKLDESDTSTTASGRVSFQGDESLWGDCRLITADWGS